jgi:hypothetical protein
MTGAALRLGAAPLLRRCDGGRPAAGAPWQLLSHRRPAAARRRDFERRKGAISVVDLIYGGPPVPLPRADDFPTVGGIDQLSVRVTAEWIAENGLRDDDAAIDEALFDISEWTEVAAARGDMLVGFSY